MSRTKKKTKGIGYEYWSRRPGNKGGGTPGRVTKTLTHRKERRLSKLEERIAALEYWLFGRSNDRGQTMPEMLLIVATVAAVVYTLYSKLLN